MWNERVFPCYNVWACGRFYDDRSFDPGWKFGGLWDCAARASSRQPNVWLAALSISSRCSSRVRSILYSSPSNESQMAYASPLSSLGSADASSPVCTESEQARIDATYFVGPDAKGLWTPVSILSIKYKHVSVSHAEAGQTATFCLQVHSMFAAMRASSHDRGFYVWSGA